MLQCVYGFKDSVLNFLIKFRHVWLNNNVSKVIVEYLKKLAGWLTLAGWPTGRYYNEITPQAETRYRVT